jgi:hypothetical protein
MDMNIQVSDVIVFGVLAFLSWYVLNAYNIIGTSKGSNRARENKRILKKSAKKQAFSRWALGQFEGFANATGGVGVRDQMDYAFIISRMRVRDKHLNRDLSPVELHGKLKLFGFFSVGAGLVLFWLTANIIFAALILGFMIPNIYKFYQNEKIRQEDLQLEKDFPDLYLLLFSRLNRVPAARLAPTLDDFNKSLEITTTDSEKIVIKKFSNDFRNLIEIFGDDSIAIGKLREKYRTATIINFVNLAIQALSGVDNRDKLAAFKNELATRKLKEMEENAERLIAIGSKVIWAVFIILFQFVVLSWASRFGGSLGDLGNLMGF